MTDTEKRLSQNPETRSKRKGVEKQTDEIGSALVLNLARQTYSTIRAEKEMASQTNSVRKVADKENSLYHIGHILDLPPGRTDADTGITLSRTEDKPESRVWLVSDGSGFKAGRVEGSDNNQPTDAICLMSVKGISQDKHIVYCIVQKTENGQLVTGTCAVDIDLLADAVMLSGYDQIITANDTDRPIVDIGSAVNLSDQQKAVLVGKMDQLAGLPPHTGSADYADSLKEVAKALPVVQSVELPRKLAEANKEAEKASQELTIKKEELEQQEKLLAQLQEVDDAVAQLKEIEVKLTASPSTEEKKTLEETKRNLDSTIANFKQQNPDIDLNQPDQLTSKVALLQSEIATSNRTITELNTRIWQAKPEGAAKIEALKQKAAKLGQPPTGAELADYMRDMMLIESMGWPTVEELEAKETKLNKRLTEQNTAGNKTGAARTQKELDALAAEKEATIKLQDARSEILSDFTEKAQRGQLPPESISALTEYLNNPDDASADKLKTELLKSAGIDPNGEKPANIDSKTWEKIKSFFGGENSKISLMILLVILETVKQAAKDNN